MAGHNPKSSSNKRPPSSSSSELKSRWRSSPTAATTATTTAGACNPPSDATKSSKPAAGSGSDSKPPSRPPSDKPTPNRGLNPSPGHTDSIPAGPHFPVPDTPSLVPPPPPPTYGFHMLDRHTIVLADGSVRSYFALPPDYQDFLPPPRHSLDRLPPLGPMSPEGFRGRDDPFGRNRGWAEASMKRKFGEEEERERDMRDEFASQRQQLLQYGNVGANSGTVASSPFRRGDDDYRSSKFMRIGGDGGGFDSNLGMKEEVDPAVLKAFLNFAKLLNENTHQRKNYLENGKHGPFQCLVCGRSSKDFPDVHRLILHIYYSDNTDLRVDHLGLHRAICVLMAWNYLRPPNNSMAYQFLPVDEAAANQDDLILWPPMVIIHNTNTGKGKDGRMEGLGNKTMDNKIRDMGFPGGKSKSLYSREGHIGITLIKFASDQSGLKEAMRLADHFEQGHHGHRDWARVQSITGGGDDESNPNLVLLDERTGESRRILYGYLGTASDMDKLDYETRKKVLIESKHEKLQPPK